jgi:hypothetical protein
MPGVSAMFAQSASQRQTFSRGSNADNSHEIRL